MKIKLIFISGTSSTGKSTVGKILHRKLQKNDPRWLNFKVDDFLRMIGDNYLDLFHNPEIYSNGISGDLMVKNEYYFVENNRLKYGTLAGKLFQIIPNILEQILQQDFYIICDAFFETDSDVKILKEKFSTYNPKFIYFKASKETRSRREAERMDRFKGMSDNWLESFCCEESSDFIINTDDELPECIADKILNYLTNC